MRSTSIRDNDLGHNIGLCCISSEIYMTVGITSMSIGNHLLWICESYWTFEMKWWMKIMNDCCGYIGDKFCLCDHQNGLEYVRIINRITKNKLYKKRTVHKTVPTPFVCVGMGSWPVLFYIVYYFIFVITYR